VKRWGGTYSVASVRKRQSQLLVLTCFLFSLVAMITRWFNPLKADIFLNNRPIYKLSSYLTGNETERVISHYSLLWCGCLYYFESVLLEHNSTVVEVIGFFSWPNPFSRTVSLGSIQPLTAVSTRNLPGGKERPARKADNHTAICEPIVYKMWEPRRLITLWASTTCYRDRFILMAQWLFHNVILLQCLCFVSDNKIGDYIFWGT
jgi:hypothetical protein